MAGQGKARQCGPWHCTARQGRGRRKRNCRNGTQERRAPKRTAQRARKGRSARLLPLACEALRRSRLRLPLPLPDGFGSLAWRRVALHSATLLLCYYHATLLRYRRRGRQPWRGRSAQNALERAGKPFPLHRPDCSGEALRRHPQALSGHVVGPYGGAPLPSGAEPPAERSRPNFQNGMSMRGYLEMRQGRVKTSIGRRPLGRGNATAPALGWPKQHSRRRGSLRRFGTQDAADAERRCRKERPEAGGRAGPFPHPVGGAWPFPADGGQPFPQEGKGGRPWASTI